MAYTRDEAGFQGELLMINAYCPKCKKEIKATYWGSYRCPKCSIVFSWFDDPFNIEAERIAYHKKHGENRNATERSN